MSHFCRKSDTGAALANFLTEGTKPLTDRGHWGSGGGVTVSHEREGVATGGLRQCRSDFSFGYMQKCSSCIKGCSDDRCSCELSTQL